MRPTALFAALLLVASFLAGCGGGGQSSTDEQVARTGSARLKIDWPARDRLIPFVTESITVSFLNGSNVVATQTVERPDGATEVTVPFTDLPATSLTLSAVAYPNPNGTGTAVARATSTVTVVADQTTTFRITMGSTITLINLSPAAPSVSIGSTVTLSVVASNSAGAIVLTEPSKIEWTSSDASVATVNANGVVTGVKAGTTTITARDTESGVRGTTIVTVAPGTGGIVVIVK